LAVFVFLNLCNIGVIARDPVRSGTPVAEPSGSCHGLESWLEGHDISIRRTKTFKKAFALPFVSHPKVIQYYYSAVNLPQLNMPASSKPIALVTGASSGIGRTSSIALIKAGWRVVLSGRRKEELETTAEMARKALREDGKEDDSNDDQLVLVAVGDVSQESHVKEMFEQIKQVYGE
jgi:hypothetical protein